MRCILEEDCRVFIEIGSNCPRKKHSSWDIIRRMKFCIRILFLVFPIFAFADNFGMEQGQEIIVNNRILATVNGKNISVVDVMKKMDIQLLRSYPDYAKSPTHRYQFFSQNWRQFLNQLIDNELILADAARLEIKISDADIREAIHERFGPNVMVTLDDLGVTLDEAWHMLYVEKAVQQMNWYRVYSKAMQRIGPQDIKIAYASHLEKNPPQEEWKYQVLSIRAKTEQLGSIYAQKAHALIRNEPLPFEVLAKKLKEEKEIDPSITINVSDEYNVAGKDLSKSHKSVLCSLVPGAYSDPIPQVSRHDNSTVHRIFHLKDHIINAPPKFDSMVDELHDDLVQKEIGKEFPPYLRKLRNQFNFDQKQIDSIPSDFQPFTLH